MITIVTSVVLLESNFSPLLSIIACVANQCLFVEVCLQTCLRLESTLNLVLRSLVLVSYPGQFDVIPHYPKTLSTHFRRKQLYTRTLAMPSTIGGHKRHLSHDCRGEYDIHAYMYVYTYLLQEQRGDSLR